MSAKGSVEMPSKSVEPDGAPGGAAAVDRALNLLRAFRTGDQTLQLTELAQRTGLYKSTAMRLIASLEHAGMLQRLDDGRYALGSELARLHTIYTASFSLDRLVMPVLQALVDRTGESAAYNVRQPQGAGWARLCLYRVDSPNVLRDHARAGDLQPADRGAGARVLIAFGSDFDPSGLDRKARVFYEDIRRKGYCAIKGDRTPELAGIAAPVFHADGLLAGAVALSVPTYRFERRCIEPVCSAAAQLTGKL
jgi:DNA-binding IclR family transcriptional regulator